MSPFPLKWTLPLSVAVLSFGIVATVVAATTGNLLPQSDGTYKQWTPKSGSTHFTMVDESACNGSTDYVSTTGIGKRDSFIVNLSSIPDNSAITQIDITPCASKNSSGGANSVMSVFYRFNGVNSTDAGNYSLSATTPTTLSVTSFSGLSHLKSSGSALEIGAVLKSGSKGARLSRMSVSITYDQIIVRPSVRGVSFNPQIVNEQGVSYGSSWLKNYGNAYVRTQAIQEMNAIKSVTNLDSLSLFTTANREFSWPTPTQSQITNIAHVINDAHAEGLRTVLVLSTPCVIPNSAIAPTEPKQHVGGHLAGEVVNGTTLYWDVAYCADNSIDLAKAWYQQILTGLAQNLISQDSIAYVALAGHPYAPFATEMNLFYDNYAHLDLAQAYVAALVPYIKSVSSFPLGIETLPGFWSTDPDFRYSFLDNLFAAVPPSQWDYIDITSKIELDPVIVTQKVGAAYAQKVILSDFKYNESALSMADTSQWHFDTVRNHAFGGWWIWQYKDENLLGIRERGFFGLTGGWKTDVIDRIVTEMAQ